MPNDLFLDEGGCKEGDLTFRGELDKHANALRI